MDNLNQFKWAFICKRCNAMHLIPYSKLKKNSRNYEVLIKCPILDNIYSMSTKYEGTSFKLIRESDKTKNYKVVNPTKVKRVYMWDG